MGRRKKPSDKSSTFRFSQLMMMLPSPSTYTTPSLVLQQNLCTAALGTSFLIFIPHLSAGKNRATDCNFYHLSPADARNLSPFTHDKKPLSGLSVFFQT